MEKLPSGPISEEVFETLQTILQRETSDLMITDKEYEVYEAFLTRLTIALTSLPDLHEKELDLAHAWLHDRIKGKSPRNYQSNSLRN